MGEKWSGEMAEAVEGSIDGGKEVAILSALCVSHVKSYPSHAANVPQL